MSRSLQCQSCLFFVCLKLFYLHFYIKTYIGIFSQHTSIQKVVFLGCSFPNKYKLCMIVAPPYIGEIILHHTLNQGSRYLILREIITVSNFGFEDLSIDI